MLNSHSLLKTLFCIMVLYVTSSCKAPYQITRDGYVSSEREQECFSLVLSKELSKNFPEDAEQKGILSLKSSDYNCDSELMLETVKSEACDAQANVVLVSYQQELNKCIMTAEFYSLEPKGLDYQTMLAIQQELYEIKQNNNPSSGSSKNEFGSGFMGGIAAVGLTILITFLLTR